MNRTNRKGLLGAAVLALVATAVLAAPSGNTALRPIDAYASLVGSKDDISFPKDFPNGYIFIRTWAVAGGDGVADVHSVYSRPQDVAQFWQTGKWPDGAVIIKEVSSTIGAPHTTGKAFWANETQTWFLMVKDTHEVSKALPNEVWLTALSRAGKRVDISGIAFSNFNVATLMTNLGQAGPLISNVDLVVSEKTLVEQVPVERFTITMEIKDGKS